MKKTILALAVLTAVLFAGDFEDGVQSYTNKDYKKAVKFYQKKRRKFYRTTQNRYHKLH